MRCTALLALLLYAALAASCSPRPPLAIPVDGVAVEHPEAAFKLTVPEGWQSNLSNSGISLVRSQPYGGGYPTLNIRRISDEQAESLRFDGSSFDNESGRVEYRYQRWNNPRGAGYRLEALLSGDSGLLFADASIWDPAKDLNRAFFEDAFWPIINSVRRP